MARNNRERNEWVVSLMEVQPNDRILEIGFGPGVAIEKLSYLVTTGFVAGIDASEIMVRQARKRNARAWRLQPNQAGMQAYEAASEHRCVGSQILVHNHSLKKKERKQV